MKFASIIALAAAASAVRIDGDDGIIDALTPQKGNCEERLWINQDELEWQMDQFSRKFDIRNYNNAAKIASELKTTLPAVKTWELLDKSFSFPRIRRFETVQENMDMVEHFQDNLNLNPTNSINVDNFIRSAKTAVANIKDRYHDGEFSDPALFDPREEAKKKAAGN